MIKETIIESFNTWTDAQGVKSKGKVKSIENISLEGVARLRELILELAVKGKLVDQISSEESAHDLIEKIRYVQLKRLNEKELKQQKKIPDVDKRDLPYDIPRHWIWCRLGKIARIINGRAYKKDELLEDSSYIPVLRVGNLFTSRSWYYSDLVLEPDKYCDKGDLLYAWSASFGPFIWDAGKVIYHYHIWKLDHFNQLDTKYLYYFLLYETDKIKASGHGVSMVHMTKAKMELLYTPVPPLEEQKRIVAKVDELMVLCDQLEEQRSNNLKTHHILVKTLLDTLTQAKDADEVQVAWERLSVHFDTLFCSEDSIDQLKQTILQLGVMGRLVKQDPSDEPANVLLEKIAVEKVKLIEEGKIRKQKTLPKITVDEFPFDLPNNWEWSRLGNITLRIGSGSTPRGGKSAYQNSGILFLRSQNIWNDGIKVNDATFISEEIHKKMSNTKVFPNDILLNITGGSLGRCAIFTEEHKEANVSQHVSIIRAVNDQFRFFIHLFILSPYGQNLIWGRQVGANREGLSKKVLELFEVPIPPLEEQVRIVSKISELLSVCDSLSERLIKAQKIQDLLSKTIVEKAV